MKPAQKTLTLLAMLVAAGVVVTLISGRHSSPPSSHALGAPARVIAKPRTPVPVASGQPGAAHPATAASLGGDAAFIAMTRDVVLRIASGDQLELSRAERGALQHEFKILSYERMLLEQKLATAEKASTGETLIQVPAYQAAGAALYASFTAEVTALLGPVRAQEFISRNQRDIVLQNNELGQHPQTLLVTLNAESGIYHIVHNMHVSSAMLGIEGDGTIARLSTSDLRAADLSVYTYLKPLLPH